MIIFKRIKYQNFLATGNVPIELFLNQSNRTLFCGLNGAGKSTPLSAITFALFGHDFRGINKPLLVNSINGKNLLVELDFETDGKNYKIKRGIKPNVFEIYLDGSLINQTAAARDYQKYIEEHVIKLNFTSFKQIVVLNAKKFVPFMTLKAGERREIIESLLDLSVFTRMNVLLKSRIQTNKETMDEVDGLVSIEKQKNNVLVAHLQRIDKESAIKRDEMLAEIERLFADNVDKQKELDALLEEVTAIQNKQTKLLAVEKKKMSITNAMDGLTRQKRKLQTDIGFYTDKDNCPTCHQIIDQAFKTTTIANTQNHIEQLDTQHAELLATLKKIQQTIDGHANLNKEYGTKNAQVSRLQGDIHGNQRHIRLLETEIKKVLTEDTERNAIVAQIEEIKTILAAFEVKRAELIEEKEVQLYALSLLKDSGIKTKIIQTYIPMMNKLINGFLSALDFYVQFEIDENFNEVIRSRYRDEFTYANFSDGEQQRIDLAILFTWRHIAKLKNSMAVNLLVLDEVGDSSLDGQGVEDLIKILYTLKDTNIILISHKEILLDRFDRVLKFEKQNNFTTVKEL